MERINCTLLVDDDVTTNFMNEILIDEMEITNRLLTARNGKEALQLLQQQCQQTGCPQLILLDVNMPVMNGFEFLEAFQTLELKDKSTVVIFMLTTSLNPKDLARVKKFPVAGYINKPLTEAALKSILQEHFRGSTS